MSIDRKNKNPLNRDQALNDATGGRLGEEPRSEPGPESISKTRETEDLQDLRRKALASSLEICNKRSIKWFFSFFSRSCLITNNSSNMNGN